MVGSATLTIAMSTIVMKNATASNENARQRWTWLISAPSRWKTERFSDPATIHKPKTDRYHESHDPVRYPRRPAPRRALPRARHQRDRRRGAEQRRPHLQADA